MIVAIAIASGFRHELRSAISELAGDIQLTPQNLSYVGEDEPISSVPSFVADICSVEGVRQVEPVIYRAGIVKSGESIHGVMVKGTRSDTLSNHVRIPNRLARILSLNEGDSMLTYFVGERIKARKFTISEIYDEVLGSDDALIVYAPIEDMRRLNGWAQGEASALEISLDDHLRSPKMLEAKNAEIGTIVTLCTEGTEEELVSRSSVTRYGQLFDWLGLLDFNVVFILVLMTIVAGFNMISGLLILLFRNIFTIGILKSMGMTDRGISSVFLRVASTLILKGMATGNLIALAFCAIQGTTHLLRLNPANYFVSFVPVSVNVPMILLADIVAYALIMLLLLIPCRFISRVDPAQSVKAE